MTYVGITGHQGLQPTTQGLVAGALENELLSLGPLHGITSLAEGADQIFAERVLALGGTLTAVIPAAGYEDTFQTDSTRKAYRVLLARSDEILELPYTAPCEDAYWAAGQRIVTLAEVLLAVWDGEPSRGRGGTADVVAHARKHGVPVRVIWPSGASRR